MVLLWVIAILDPSQYKTVSSGYGNSHVNMKISKLVRRYLYIETAPGRFFISEIRIDAAYRQNETLSLSIYVSRGCVINILDISYRVLSMTCKIMYDFWRMISLIKGKAIRQWFSRVTQSREKIGESFHEWPKLLFTVGHISFYCLHALYGGVEGPSHIFQHHAISYGSLSNSSVWDSNYCFLIRRTC